MAAILGNQTAAEELVVALVEDVAVWAAGALANATSPFAVKEDATDRASESAASVVLPHSGRRWFIIVVGGDALFDHGAPAAAARSKTHVDGTLTATTTTTLLPGEHQQVWEWLATVTLYFVALQQPEGEALRHFSSQPDCALWTASASPITVAQEMNSAKGFGNDSAFHIMPTNRSNSADELYSLFEIAADRSRLLLPPLTCAPPQSPSLSSPPMTLSHRRRQSAGSLDDSSFSRVASASAATVIGFDPVPLAVPGEAVRPPPSWLRSYLCTPLSVEGTSRPSTAATACSFPKGSFSKTRAWYRRREDALAAADGVVVADDFSVIDAQEATVMTFDEVARSSSPPASSASPPRRIGGPWDCAAGCITVICVVTAIATAALVAAAFSVMLKRRQTPLRPRGEATVTEDATATRATEPFPSP